MSRVIRLGIAKNNNQKIQEVEKIQLLPGKGVVGDRHFHENNTLFEDKNSPEARFLLEHALFEDKNSPNACFPLEKHKIQT